MIERLVNKVLFILYILFVSHAHLFSLQTCRREENKQLYYAHSYVSRAQEFDSTHEKCDVSINAAFFNSKLLK